ncbi:MAG: regulatory protein RecX [Microbacterium sp.]|uniref:regulatory protein RecX n=1 Tax=Microbacterium sp. TaxID=51671 RepID=UPI003242EAE9
MTRETGGEQSLAPVIPLFGGGAVSRGSVSRGSVSRDNGLLGEDRGEACAELSAGTWHSTWVDDDDIGEYDDDRYLDDPYGESRASSAVTRAALDRLIKRLRRRGLSEAEATDELVADGVEKAVAEVLVADLVGKRWLGDADLAEQLVHTAVTRRREGRRAIAQVLAKRRIPRDVADAALATLPDDDAERALEFARQKAGGYRGVAVDVAIRRLVGQLQRRGYPPGVAMTAARLALAEPRD